MKQQVCDGCDHPRHINTDYDDCIMSSVPDTKCDCPVSCMDNYSPSDDDLFSQARRANIVPKDQFRSFS